MNELKKADTADTFRAETVNENVTTPNEDATNGVIMRETTILAVDPGKDKCGVAVVRANGVRGDAFRGDSARQSLGAALNSHCGYRVLVREIVPRAAILSSLEKRLTEFSGAILVVGHATTSRALRAQLAAQFPQIQVQTEDETGSTLEARALYWKEKPARGWRRFWPQSLQNPPEPIDDFAAIVLAQRFLQRLQA